MKQLFWKIKKEQMQTRTILLFSAAKGKNLFAVLWMGNWFTLDYLRAYFDIIYYF